ncbi:hypothetical protein [Rhodopseudomonas sp. BR0C11]|uniref:hypothetical protein n=1 Tax=Rhodopseudomonas sp. BR0C11 TaxID=2269370 RepID=UPI001FEED129|nr:hypothetical protein [Rhodopseudomonas sp. BR0C11]
MQHDATIVGAFTLAEAFVRLEMPNGGRHTGKQFEVLVGQLRKTGETIGQIGECEASSHRRFTLTDDHGSAE